MTGDQFKRLLAECNLTAGQMAKRLGTNHARVFYVMKHGLTSRSVIRDWLQAATGSDPGMMFNVEQIITQAAERDESGFISR